MVYSGEQQRQRNGDLISALVNFEDLVAPSQERSIAGFMLVDGSEAALEIFDEISPEEFHGSASAKAVMQSCYDLWQSSRDINPRSVTQAMREAGTLQEIGGTDELTRLQGVAALDVAEALGACQTVREYAGRRALYLLGRETSANALRLSTPLDDIRSQLEANLLNSIRQVIRAHPEVVNTVLQQAFSEIEERSVGNVLPGIPCGLYDLDAMTQGFQRSDLICIAGRPSMGKTAMLLRVATGICNLYPSQPVLIFSLEMSKLQLVYRLLSSETGIESSRLRSGRIAQHEWETLGNALSVISRMPIYLDDTANITVSEVRSKARRLAMEHGGASPVVFIDYLQLMEGATDNRVQELAKISRSLKGLARELNVPLFFLSQLSRAVESRANKRPMMADLRESGALEQDCDLIMMLYREEYYEPDTPERGIAEVIVTKHRNGPTGTVKLLFEPQFTRFRNLASPDGHQTVNVPVAPNPPPSRGGAAAAARAGVSTLGSVAMQTLPPPPEPEEGGMPMPPDD